MNALNLSDVRPEAAGAMAMCLAIAQQREAVDARLRYPAAWRGAILPREESGELPSKANTVKYAAAFDFLREAHRQNRALDPTLFFNVAEQMAGLHAFRQKAMENNSRPHQISAFTARALDRAQDGKEPPPLAAARLHLELQIIRPFARSNGRLARLMASYVLMRAGYRSTLFTAAEQHFLPYPDAYVKNFADLAASRGDAWPWLTKALEAMARRSCRAAWFCRRESELRAKCRKLGLKGRVLEQALIDYDAHARPAGPLVAAMRGVESPLGLWRKHAGEVGYAELMSQLKRLRAEEADDLAGK